MNKIYKWNVMDEIKEKSMSFDKLVSYWLLSNGVDINKLLYNITCM